jgi:hypothetical protein
MLMTNYSYISENTTLAKFYLKSGQLSIEDFEKIKSIDPTKTNKYTGWIAKQLINNKIPTQSDPNSDELIINWDLVKEKIQQYNDFSIKNKVITKNIDDFRDFDELVHEVQQTTAAYKHSPKLQESHYEILVDNKHLLVICPHEHLASRKVGLKYFAQRVCTETLKKDSAWCTTFKNDSQFVSKYFVEDNTLYYCAINSEKLLLKLMDISPENGRDLIVLAILVERNGNYVGSWDAKDQYIDVEKTKEIVNVLNKYSKK